MKQKMECKKRTLYQQDNTLYKLVCDMYERFKGEAKKHKRLSRSLWWISAIISLIIAVCNNFDFAILDEAIESKHISALLALILPMVTAYIVFRTPQKLWINEISTRNQLSNLIAKIELGYARNDDFDEKPLENEFIKILKKADKEWVNIKQSSN